MKKSGGCLGWSVEMDCRGGGWRLWPREREACPVLSGFSGSWPQRKRGDGGLQAAGSPVMAALLWLLFWPLLLEAESKGGPGSVADGEEEKGNRGRFLVGFLLREVGITESGIRGLEAGGWYPAAQEEENQRGGGPVFFGREGTVFLWGSLLFAGKMESKLVLVLDQTKLKAERGWGGGLSVDKFRLGFLLLLPPC